LLGLFLVSGSAGLVYEVAWSRLLTLQLGGLVPALSALLAAYLGGMALGGWLGGAWSRRPGRPLRRFALIEGATAALAALVGPGLYLMTPAFRHLYRRALEGDGGFVGPAGLLAGCLVVPAAMAMGASLPVLSQMAGTDPRAAGGLAGRLYAVNTLGAVAGALLTGMVLLPRLGLAGTIRAAILANLAVAAAALLLDRGEAPAAPVPAVPRSAPRPTPLLISLGLAGTASMICQIGWTRALSLSLGSSTYAFTVTVSAFLLGLALGGAVGARWSRYSDRPATVLVAMQGGAGLAALGSIALLGRLPLWIVPPLASAGAGFSAISAVQMGAAAAVVLLPTVLLGGTFPLAVRLRGEGGTAAGRSTGDAYAAGSVGLVLGALAAGTLLLPRLGLRRSLLAAALAFGVAAVLAALSSASRRRPLRLAVGLLLAAAGGAAALPSWDPVILTSGPYLYAPLYRRGFPGATEAAVRRRGELLLYREGAAATVSVRRSPMGILSLQINGKTDASTGGDMVTQLLAGHLPGLLAPDGARSALMIGLASGVSLGALERYPFETIDCVELLPSVIEAAGLFARANGDALDDPRLRLLQGDGRNHLRYASETYDVITSQPTNPWVAGTAALYTRETFTAARDRLRDGGLMVQWIQGYALLPEDLRSVVATFLDVFPATTLWEESPAGGDYFLVGVRSGTPQQPLPVERIDERLRRPAVRADLGRAGIRDLADLLGHFVTGPEALRGYTAGAPLQRDDRLALEFSAPRALFEDTLPRQVRALRRWRESPASRIAPSLVDAVLLSRLRAARVAAREEERLLLSLPRGPVSPEPDLEIGLELLRAGLRGPAEAHLRAAVERRPDLGPARGLLGALLVADGRLEEARAELEAAVRASDTDLASLALLARVAIQLGRPEEAERAARDALEREPGDADVLNLLGAALLTRERPDEAVPFLERAVSCDPELVEAWTNLGVARRRSGDTAGAEAAYRRALTLDPGAMDARFNLALSLRLSGHPAAALDLLDRLLLDDPADLDARWERAAAYRALGRDAAAREDLEWLAARAPDSPQGLRAAGALGG
jgi:spermidine synthase